MPIDDNMASLLANTRSAKAMLWRMINLFHLAVSISPILALLPRQFNNEMIRRDHLITVSPTNGSVFNIDGLPLGEADTRE
jgi:hypothetical protein